MGIKDSNAQKLAYLWQDGHEAEWIAAFIKIVDKETNTVPFILTPEQQKFAYGLEKFNIVLKSRQLGLSVCSVALAIRQCVVYPDSACLLVSHDQKSCNSIFDKLKQQFNSLPDWLRPKTITNNRAEIKMVNGSKIVCSVAGNKDVGRGDTLQLVHLSEFAFWKNPEKQLNSITQGLSANGKLIIESTANGLNAFHDLYFKSENNENSFKSFFFNWINGSSLFTKDYESSVAIYEAKNDKLLTHDELDEEELSLTELGMTIEQAMWRKLKVASSGVDSFHMEYPSTPIEAFLSTGASIFDNKRINSNEMSIVRDKITHIPKANIVGMPLILASHYARSFFMWKLPQSGERYCLGVDLSEGVGKDNSVVEVFNKVTGEQVAEFVNNKLKPYQMAEIINELGIYYNKGLLTVEKASGGHSVLERLRLTYKYKNMTKYQSYDEFRREQWQVGFDTNSKTKSIIINDFVELFNTGFLKINSRRLLNEMKIFEVGDNGKMAASGTGHDDCVLSTAFAIVSMNWKHWYK